MMILLGFAGILSCVPEGMPWSCSYFTSILLMYAPSSTPARWSPEPASRCCCCSGILNCVSEGMPWRRSYLTQTHLLLDVNNMNLPRRLNSSTLSSLHSNQPQARRSCHMMLLFSLLQPVTSAASCHFIDISDFGFHDHFCTWKTMIMLGLPRLNNKLHSYIEFIFLIQIVDFINVCLLQNLKYWRSCC